MKYIKRKLILSVFMLLVTVLTLSSTTYAWFVKNREAWLDEFNLDIENTEGLLISTDGINFSQDISKEQIIAAIEAKTNKLYTDLSFDGVTLSHTQDENIEFKNGNPVFLKDSLTLIENTDYYSHSLIECDSSDYIAFDLYFRVITTGAQHKDYTLRLNQSSYIEASDIDLTLQNNLNTKDKTYSSGETLTINPKNAMRLGVMYNDNMAIYEPNLGLGSAAIEGSLIDEHNKDLNAMYTYYNSTHPLSKFTTAAIDGKGFETIREFGNEEYGVFTYSNDQNTYNTIKLSIFVWLEGWDADYLMGVPVTNIKIKLGFII